jgi:hypothetical protein
MVVEDVDRASHTYMPLPERVLCGRSAGKVSMRRSHAADGLLRVGRVGARYAARMEARSGRTVA